MNSSLRKKGVRAELSSLESKINPHFLFNAISSISELINFDPDSAKKMLQNISGLLRYTLRTSKNEFVQLDEEIMMIRKYLEIEKIRFGKRLEYTIDIPDTSFEHAYTSVAHTTSGGEQHKTRPCPTGSKAEKSR
jgi:two-component system, LytTR family, sensor kinase